MTVGFPQGINDLNSRIGQLTQTLRDTLQGISNYKAVLDGYTDVQLGATPFLLAAGDITTLRAGVTDLNNLYLISHAQGTMGVATIGQAAAASDFFFNAKKFIGFL